MTDYTKDTGARGTMMIRDTGSVVEFWINANEPSTFVYEMPWAYTVNGSTSSWREFRYEQGAGWQKLGSWTVTYNQTVTFKLGSTGTNALGGPTTFAKAITRATIPAKPSTPVLTGITSISIYATFSDGANGGDAIDARQIGFGVSPTSVQHIVSSDRSTTLNGLAPGTTYYVWARTHNSVGWSAWSGRASAKTIIGPAAPSAPFLSSVTATSVDISFVLNDTGGAPITAFQIGYGTNPAVQSVIVSAANPQLITGLTPGTLYYFWVRAQNSVGWGAWSASRSVRTVAGVYVKVGAETKLAVPYVKVGGVWKIAECWVRTVGEWKRTT